MKIGKTAAKFGFARFRMTGPQPRQAELANGGTHPISELKPPPSRRPTQQFDQHPLGFGIRIG
jgi:hypothetical protein